MKRRSRLIAAIAALVAAAWGAAPARLLADDYDLDVSGNNTAHVIEDAYCDTCNDCDACCDIGCGTGLWFGEGEALLWWRKSRSLPPLVTASPPGTPQANVGVLGLPTTSVLLGGDNLSDGPRIGGRFSIGRYLDPGQEYAIAGSFFILEQEENNFAADGSVGLLAIPFFNAGLVTPAEGSLLLNYPGVSQDGRVNISSQSDVMGADIYLRRLLIQDVDYRIDLIGGYQFSRVDDGLTINANYNDVSGLPAENVDITDSFLAQNEFHGGSIGLLAYGDYGRWTLKGLAKVGLGNMHQTVQVAGQTVTSTAGGASATTPSGLFSLPSNIGSYSHDEFGVIPEAKLNLGYRWNQNWTFAVGYSFMYWNNIATAGTALDRNINLTQVPGPPGLGTALVPAAPTFDNNPDFWVQGLNFSAEFAY